MGGCIGARRHGGHHSRESSDLSGTVASFGHNRPLKPRKPRWKSDVDLTEAQLQIKRDEFWDTAPAFEGRKEIWDALKASAHALESGDYQLAQAIIDGANVLLPNGTLMDCYDELGNRYQLPVYVLSPPMNLIRDGGKPEPQPSEESTPVKPGIEISVKFHLSTGKEFRLHVRTTDTILQVKRRIHEMEGIEPRHQRLFFAGKQLGDKMRIEEAKIYKGYVVQVIVSGVKTTDRDIAMKDIGDQTEQVSL